MRLASLLLFAILCDGIIGGPHARSPYYEGQYSVRSTNYNHLFHFGLDHHLAVWAPASTGSFPVIYFFSGFAGLVDPRLHSEVLSHIASHGFVVVSPYLSFGLPTSQYHAEWMIGVDAWVNKNLEDSLHNDGFNDGLTLDFDRTFLFAHSSGNHIAVNYMKLGCHNIKGISMLSPVDGVDPYGLIQEYAITPGQKLPFETPTLIISAGLDGIPGVANTGGLVPPCAPDDLSNVRFWNALRGKAWFNNATLFGHVDFLDPGATVDIADWLNICSSNDGEIDFLYRKFVAGQTISLFHGLMGHCEMFEYLQNLQMMPTVVKLKSQGETQCPVGYCKFSE